MMLGFQHVERRFYTVATGPIGLRIDLFNGFGHDPAR